MWRAMLLGTTRICYAIAEGGGGGGGAVDVPGFGQLDAGLAKVVTDNGWKTPVDAVKNYHNMSQKIGGMVVIPGADAPPEQLAAFHAKLGVPADGKYDLSDFKVPDGLPWDQSAQDAILADLHKAGATPGVVKTALKGYANFAAGQLKLRDDHAAKVHAETEPAMRKEWGDKYEAKYAAANKAIAAMFGKSLDEAKTLRLEDGSFVLDNPILAKMAAQFGETISEDGDLAGRNDSAGDGGSSDIAKMTPEQAAAEIAKIRAEAVKDDKHPYNDKANPGYKAAQQRMNDLYARKSQGKAAFVD